MMYFKLVFIGLYTLFCPDRSWYLKFEYPLIQGEFFTKTVNERDTAVFYVTSGARHGTQSQADYFDFKITPEGNQLDSVYFLFHTPGIHPLTGQYNTQSANHRVLVPLGSVFRYYDYFPDCNYYYGAITGLPLVVELESGTGNRRFKIELTDVSGGHYPKDGKPPIYLTVTEN